MFQKSVHYAAHRLNLFELLPDTNSSQRANPFCSEFATIAKESRDGGRSESMEGRVSSSI